MQNDLDAAYPELDIQILGVNEFSYEEGNDLMTAGVDIPWLQDIEDAEGGSEIWESWGVTLRDVFILDAENRHVGTYNLTEHDLEYPPYYDELRQMLIAATCPVPAGNMNDDTDVDLADWALFEACIDGPDVPYPTGCSCADLTGDGDVDLADFALFQAAFTGSSP